jgi:hypothetical protein
METMPEFVASAPLSTRQQLFLRYFTAVLVDLTVLNLFDEYWSAVTIGPFTISLLAAVLLQVMLRATLALEHRVAAFFKAKAGTAAKVARYASAWAILFLSKFVILYALHLVFGDAVAFEGPLHGVPAFIAVIMVMLATEEAIIMLYRKLA